MSVLLIFGLGLGGSPPSGQPGQSEPQKLLMGVLGDSISAGTLADLPIPKRATAEESVLAWARQNEESRWLYENKRKYSWGSGRSIDSHYRLLSRYLSKYQPRADLGVLNHSQPGGTAESLIQQAKLLAQGFRSGGYQELVYVVMSIGANDACNSGLAPDISKMRDSLFWAVTILGAEIRQENPIRILILGVPRIADLGAKRIRNYKTLFGLSCETVRNRILHFCDSLTLWSTHEEYEVRSQVVDQINAMLRDFVRGAQSWATNVEMFYSPWLAEAPISLPLMAADCFHPSFKGQEEISVRSWREQPWFRG